MFKEERRKFPRVNLPCKIDVGLPVEHVLNVHADNIGCGGIKFIANENLDVSTVVGLEIFLFTGDTVKCRARVVWNVKKVPLNNEVKDLFDIGLEFLDIKDIDRNLVNELVDKLLKD